MSTVNQETFEPFAFPVARVRFSGPTNSRGSRYFASIRRDSERTYRASVGELDAERPRDGALRAARAAEAKMRADLDWNEDTIAIPGDLAADSYAFTFVPVHYFNGHTPTLRQELDAI